MDRLDYAFVIFFVTLGPVKCIAPFLHTTAAFDEATKHRLALKGTAVAALVGLFIVFVGNSLRTNWGVGQAELLVTFGILLLISALQQLNTAMHIPPTQEPPTDAAGVAMSPIAFPMIITPYGIVALLLFAAVAQQQRTFLTGVFVLFLGMMVLDYLAMRYAKQIMGFVRPQVLQAFGWVLGVLQASLAVLALMSGLRMELLGTVAG